MPSCLRSSFVVFALLAFALGLRAQSTKPPDLLGMSGTGSVDLGQQVLLGVRVAGTEPDFTAGFTYRWFKGEDEISGANTSSYVIAHAAPTDAGTYRVVVTNSAGSSVATGTLTVKEAAPPVITTQPRVTVADVGQTVVFTQTSTGSYPRTYQWMKNGQALATATATSSGLVLGPLTTADAGAYSVKIANALGEATSTAASLTVNAAKPPVIGSGYPSDFNAVQGQSYSLSVFVSSGSSPFTYQWLKNGVPIPGATSNIFTFSSLALSDAGKYSVTVSNIAGTATSREATATVTPATPIVIIAQPQAQTVFLGQSVYFSFSASGSSPTIYQWRKNGVAISGAIASSYSINPVAYADAGDYSVVITNTLGSVTSQSATLVVNPPVLPTITSQPVSPVAAAYNSTVSLSVQVSGTTPLTFQWKKDGVNISGGASSILTLYNATPANSGAYTVTVSNAAGSVTSNVANLTVAAATPPSITQQPRSVTLGYYQSLELNVGVSGTSPFTFQWRRNGVAIASATSSSYSIYNATSDHNGTYSVVVTNAGGSVTSADAIVSVSAPVRPSVTRQPIGQNVAYNSSLQLFAEITGSNPLSLQWYKDGVAINGATSGSYGVSFASPSDSGIYTLVASNPAGSVTTTPATVKVAEAALPVITQQPASREVALGLSASFEVRSSGAGTGPVTVQWFRNGAAITGITYEYLSLNSVKESDAGDYWAVLTSAAGSVTSSMARLTVLPPQPPVVSAWPSSPSANLGDSASFSVYATGSPPFTYQWAKDGVPISGATNASYTVSRITTADFANYTVTIRNAGGIITSPPARLTFAPNSGGRPFQPWLDAVRSGDIVYILATSPARIERYDLATERWLSTVTLSENPAPTAFLPTPEGVYIAYGRVVTRRALDLTGETAIANAPQNVTHLFAYGNYLYFSYSSTSYGRLSRSNPQGSAAIETSSGQIFRNLSFTPGSNRAYAPPGYSSSTILRVSFAADGSLTTLPLVTGDAYFGANSTLSRTMVSADEQLLFDNAGTIRRTSDGGFVASLGEGCLDMALLSDGTPVILRANYLTAVRPDTYLESGRVTLSDTGWQLFARNTDAFVFGPLNTTTGRFAVTKFAKSDLRPPATTGATAPPTGAFSCDDAFLGADGVVYIFSRSLIGFARWSSATRSWLSTVPVRDSPTVVSTQPGASRALLAYGDGQLTEVRLSAGDTAERQISSVSNGVRTMVDLDDMVMFNLSNAGQGGGDFRAVLGSSGVLRSIGSSGGFYSHSALAWLPSSRRLYSRSQSNSAALVYETITATGTVSTTDAPVTGTLALTAPLRFSPDNAFIATGNGRIVSTALVGAGTLSNNFMDGAWLGGTFYSMDNVNGGTRVQKWAPTTYLQTGSVSLPGSPLRIFSLSDTQLVVIGSLFGAPTLTVLNSDLTISTLAGRVAITNQPQAQSGAADSSVTLNFTHSSTSTPAAVSWSRNGNPIWSATSATFRIGSLQPADTGLYLGTVTTPAGSVTSDPAIVGLTSTAKVVGAGSEVGANIVHPLGNVYDQVLLQGSAATVTADAGQVLRISYVDLSDDIVQVEFSGAGTLSLTLDNPKGPATAVNYNQPGVSYMKGHAGIVITGADETTNVSVFSVGRANAVNQALFKSDVTYDGVADIAFIAISSRDGKFGGVRTANANYFATKGVTGLYAPGVEFTGPVFVGDVNAFDQSEPMLVLGSVADIRVTGGDLAQDNGHAVRVKGISRLNFVAGSTSHDVILPAKTNRARLVEDGVDVTARLVPTP